MTRELIVLHAGLHKTGSSSIQATLQGYDDGTTRYADLGSPNHSKFFDSAFADEPRVRWNDGEKTMRAERWHKRLLRETTTDRSRLIFSGEAISVLGPSGVTRMVDFFAPHARQLRVVAYARDPRSYIASSFQQRIKFGVSEFRIPQQRPFFRERLSPFFEILGKEAVEVVPFLSFAKTGKDVVEDFCTRAGVTPAQIVRSNESMSADAIRLIYLWNKGSGETVQGPARKRLIALLRAHFPGRFSLDSALTADSVNWDDVDWLETTLGQPVADRTPPDDAGTQDAIASESDLLAVPAETLERLRALAAEMDPERAPPREVDALLDVLKTACLRQAAADGEEDDEDDRPARRPKQKKTA